MLHDLFQYNSLICLATALLYEEKLLVDISLDLHHQFADKVSIADQSPLLLFKISVRSGFISNRVRYILALFGKVRSKLV